MIEETTTLGELHAVLTGARIYSLTLTYNRPLSCYYASTEGDDGKQCIYGMGTGPLASDAIRQALANMRPLRQATVQQ